MEAAAAKAVVLSTGSSNVTHHVCPCGSVLYCSDAEPWTDEQGNELEYGWCRHILDDGAPSATCVEPPNGEIVHQCRPLAAEVELLLALIDAIPRGRRER